MRTRLIPVLLATGLLTLLSGRGVFVPSVLAAEGGVPVPIVPPSQEPVFSWSGYFEAIGIMMLLLGGLWFALWLIRRYGKFKFLPSGQGFPRDALRMEAQLPLGPKKGLVVVRFLNERLLLGVTEHHISVLSERLIRETSVDDDESTETASSPTTASPSTPADSGASFAELLHGTGKAPGERT